MPQTTLSPFENAEIITTNVGSTDKKVVALEKAGHIVSLSDEKDKIHQEVLEFISRH